MRYAKKVYVQSIVIAILMEITFRLQIVHHNEKIKDEVTIFKENLIKGLLDIKFQNKIECLNIDKLVKYIEIL